ncbi:MAG: CorA family divalent cation transporter [Janthinobacterium lividum]
MNAALEPATVGARLGLVWGFDIGPEGAVPIDTALPEIGLSPPPPGTLRWLHVALADQWTRRWIMASGVSPDVRDLLLSTDRHQRALVDGDALACILHDFERDFDTPATARMGSLAVLLLPRIVVTARLHPLCAADIVHRRIRSGTAPVTTAAAFDLLLSAVTQVASEVAADLTVTVQTAEDALLDNGRDPDPRELLIVRKRAIQVHRQMSGLRGVLARLEDDDDLPIDLAPTIEKLAQRTAAVDGDILAIQANLRLLREELEVQTANRTGQNLYLLSILSALLLPATLVTGIFGMNTGGLPWASVPHGTLLAVGLVVASSAMVYFWLYAQGFFRR